jgi:hypothetical protein
MRDFINIILEAEMDDPAAIVQRVIDEYGMSPKYINNGWCFGFAGALQTALGDGAKIVNTGNLPGVFPGHSVVLYRGRYYDAETPNGVVDPLTLPYNIRIRATKDAPKRPKGFPGTIEPAKLVEIVKKIHHTENDFVEGNLVNRIWRFEFYVLEWVPIAMLNLNQWDVDDELVAQYAAMKGQYPPIIYDEIDESIIDGVHRARAADLRGDQYVLAYYGNAADENPDWIDDEED